MKRILLVLVCIAGLLFAVSCKQQATKGAESSISGMGDIKMVKITAPSANVKTGCSNSSPTIQTSNKDNTLDCVSKVSNWYAVKLPNNAIGFVPENQCKPVVVEDKKPNITPGTSGTGSPTATAPGSQTNPNSTSLSAEEQQMLTLVNQARSQNGAPALQVDMELANVARLKSQDMITNNYFSHNSPTYGSPFDMMKNFGISYVKAGENIAGNQSVQAAHNALMNSPGHRKNILDPDFTHIGIGIKKGSSYGNIFTQMFISKPR